MTAIKRSYLGLKALLAAALSFCVGIVPGIARAAQSSAHQDRNPLIQRLSDSRTYDELLASSGNARESTVQQLAPETMHKATQKSDAKKSKLQPKQAIRLSPARQPQQAIRLSPAMNSKRSSNAKKQPRQAIRLSPARQPQQAIRLSPATKAKQPSHGASNVKKQPRQAIRLSPAGQPQQAIRLSPAMKSKE
jgi:hypothetical protein